MIVIDDSMKNGKSYNGNSRKFGITLGGDDYIVYDNGACLFPDVLSHILEYEDNHTREQFLYDRCMKFPASLFKMRRPKDRAYRTNYYEMFGDLRINKVYAEVVRSFKNRYTYRDIFHTAHKIVSAQSIDPRWLSIILRRFYVEIITLRYMFIVLRMDFSKSYKIVEDMLYKL